MIFRGMCAMFANELIMVDGGTPRKCTAAYAVSDLSSDGSMPTDSTAVHVHQHKVWLNSASNPMKAYYSKTDSANAADSWSAADDAGSLDFSKILPFGDKLLGFATFAEVFIVFIFEKHVLVYSAGTDPSDFALQQIIPLNTVSGHAVQQVGNDLAVCSLEGLNSFKSSLANQDLDIDDLSKYIAPLWRNLVDSLADKTTITTAFSHNLNHLYICIPDSDPTILVYSVDIRNFVGVWTGYKCHSICERRDGTMLVGGDGYVYTMNTGDDDDGSAISFQYQFPYLYAKDPNTNKAFRQIEGIVKHDGDPLLLFNYDYDGGAEQTVQEQLVSSGVYWDSDDAVWDSANWAGAGADRILNSNLLGRGKAMALTINNSTLDSYVEILHLILKFKKEGVKIR